jgi:hypothetical protein
MAGMGIRGLHAASLSSHLHRLIALRRKLNFSGHFPIASTQKNQEEGATDPLDRDFFL